MNKFSLMPISVVLLLNLTGCASLSEEECRLGDWYQIGLTDGQEGKKNQSATYSEDCAEYEVMIDVNLYNEGRNEGLKSYCTYKNGTLVGQSNQNYENVCPADLSQEFLAGYTPYYNLAKAKLTLSSLEGDVNYYESKLGDKNISNDDKKAYISNLKSAKSELKRTEREVNKYEIELILHKLEREIEQINNELAINNLPESRKSQLNKRLVKLTDKRHYYETLSQTENTIQNIKHIVELF